MYNKLEIQNTLSKINKFNKNNFFEETDSKYLDSEENNILEQSNEYYNEKIYNTNNGYFKYIKEKIINDNYKKIYKTKKFEAKENSGFYVKKTYGELKKKGIWMYTSYGFKDDGKSCRNELY